MCRGLWTSALWCGARAAGSLQLRRGAATPSFGTCLPVFQGRPTPASALERAQVESPNFGVRIQGFLLLRGAGWSLVLGPGRERSGTERTVGAGCRSAKFTAGAEEPLAPAPPHSQVLCRGSQASARRRLCGLTARERGHSFSSASDTNLDPGALSQSFPKVAPEPARGAFMECSG